MWPPYRALPKTSSFIDYFNSKFGEETQINLAKELTVLSNKGIKLLISNSDPKNTDKMDTFFEENYDSQEFVIEQVKAYRNINSKSSGRGKITELLIRNYAIE